MKKMLQNNTFDISHMSQDFIAVKTVQRFLILLEIWYQMWRKSWKTMWKCTVKKIIEFDFSYFSYIYSQLGMIFFKKWEKIVYFAVKNKFKINCYIKRIDYIKDFINRTILTNWNFFLSKDSMHCSIFASCRFDTTQAFGDFF